MFKRGIGIRCCLEIFDKNYCINIILFWNIDNVIVDFIFLNYINKFFIIKNK